MLVIGFGSSFTSPRLNSSITNSLTRGTSSAGFIQGNTNTGYYKGEFNEINNLYIGVEGNLDNYNTVLLRGYASIGYANSANIGVLVAESKTNGATNFPDSKPNQNSTQNDFSTLPTLDTISNITNALFLSYGVGADFIFNLPISDILGYFLNTNLIYSSVAIFAGGGFEFARLSVGSYSTRTFDNAGINSTDRFLSAGSGLFTRFGSSIYLSKNLRLDFGLKIPYWQIHSSRWYIYPANQSDTFKQQLLIQKISSSQERYYFFSVNILF